MNRLLRSFATAPLRFAPAALCTSFVFVACSGTDDPRPTFADPDPPVQVDQTEIVHGVPDHGRNPAVVAIDIGGEGLCSGSLIARDVVLTARHCVSRTRESVECPPREVQVLGERAPSSFTIFVGDDVATARPVARARQVIVPDGRALCDEDIALLVLDRVVPGVAPLAVRTRGVAQGDHVRAVGFGRPGDGDPAGTKRMREHVRVQEVSAHEFLVGESTCQGDSGGPALDEDSGEVVGVVSRGGPSCDGRDAHNVYTRSDVFLPLIDEAIAASKAKPEPDPDGDAGAPTPPPLPPPPDGGGGPTPPKTPPGHGKGATDMGAACTKADDCSTGVCVKDHDAQYCSRECGTGDRCPAHYHCTRIKTGTNDAEQRSICIKA